MKTTLIIKRLILGQIVLLCSVMANGQTIINGSFDWDGIQRTYRLYIPASYNPASAMPLVFNLHGYGSNNVEQEQYGDFRPIADTAGFIIAHPNGTLDGSGNRFWNTFGASTVDDLGFLSALIDSVSADYNIDSYRIYSTGMSNGGFMSYELACFLNERIAAVASVTGSMTKAKLALCNPQHPTPVMQIHGTADATVPYNGNFLFAHIDTLVKYWVTFNNCLPNPQIIQLPDIDPNDGCTAEQHFFGGGDQGSSVELFKVLGGGHSWPGAPININITNMDFSASIEIWRFFNQYSLDALTTGNIEKPAVLSGFEVFPNPSEGLISLRFEDDFSKTITVTSSSGQLVFQEQCSCSTTEIYLDKKGIYFLTATKKDNSVFSKKVVVQ